MNKPFTADRSEKALREKVVTMPCDCTYGTCNDGLMEVWIRGKKSTVFTRCMLKQAYEQGKIDMGKDILELRCPKCKKQVRIATLEEANKKWKETLHGKMLFMDFENSLSQQLKEARK